MPSLTTLAIVALPVIIGLGSFLPAKIELLGLMRPTMTLNNEGCVSVPGLEACEDAWIHEASGLAYLPCSSRAARLHWVPAMLHLDAESLPPWSTDHVSLYDFGTNSHRKLEITNLPAESQGIYVHAIDVWVDEIDPTKLTVFLNSHRPPKDRADAPLTGADSVIEIFETILGSDTLNWVDTIKHELIRTPNNLVAMGPRSFFVSNDHRRKVHWTRKFEAIKGEGSDLIHCDASAHETVCVVAADDLTYPNGIAKGLDGLIYSASSLAGNIRVWEEQADHSLILIDEIILPRPTDNIHVSPTGDIYAACFGKVLALIESATKEGAAKGVVSPTEIWKISKNNSEDKFYGKKYNVELVFADDGHIMSGATTAAPYQNKLLLTGVSTKVAKVCTLP